MCVAHALGIHPCSGQCTRVGRGKLWSPPLNGKRPLQAIEYSPTRTDVDESRQLRCGKCPRGPTQCSAKNESNTDSPEKIANTMNPPYASNPEPSPLLSASPAFLQLDTYGACADTAATCYETPGRSGGGRGRSGVGAQSARVWGRGARSGRVIAAAGIRGKERNCTHNGDAGA